MDWLLLGLLENPPRNEDFIEVAGMDRQADSPKTLYSLVEVRRP